MIEEWRPVVGFEGLYSVSSLGRIRRDAGGYGATVGRILRLNIKKRDGYQTVSLARRGVGTTCVVHTLVLTAFLGPRPEGKVGNHIDAVRHNNALHNLEWVTPSENRYHTVALGNDRTPRGESHPQSKLTDAQCAAIRASTESNAVLGRRYGVNAWTAQRIRLGQRRNTVVQS